MVLPGLSDSSSGRAERLELAGRVLAGRYRLVAPIGAGASARVYLADDVQLRRRVAVKVLHPGLAADPTFLRRFQAEAQAAAALNHPNVVAVYDWGRDAEQLAAGEGAMPGAAVTAVPFLVTEYLGGGSLRAVLDGPEGHRGGRLLSLSQTLLVGLQVARGLSYAHSRGFVHRDIKPANLLFGEDGRLRIADFGLARALAEASWTEPEGVVLGTARYVSPEQAEGLACDPRSDLYSLALVLVECVTGSVPHTADTAMATLAARVGRDLVVDPEVFGSLAPLLEAAGRADPEARPSAAELAAALLAAARELSAPDPLPLAPPRLFTPPAVADGGTRLMGDDPPAVPVGAPPAAGTDGSSSQLPGPSTGVQPPAPEATSAPVLPGVLLVGAGPLVAGPDRPSDAPAGAAVTGRRLRRGGRVRAGGRGRRRRPRLRTVAVSALVLSALTVAAVLGVTLFGGRLFGPPRFEVGNYVGRDVDEVRQELETAGYGWRLELGGERRDGVPLDEIIDQAPVAGEQLARGAVLRLVRSLGNTLVTVPSVAGRSIDDAEVQQAFTAASLLIGRVDRADENAPVGRILSVADAGRQVEKFSRVQVVVSSGPPPRTVADYGNPARDGTAAQAELTAAGLMVEVVPEASEKIDKGKVIRTEPAAGTQVPKGGTVKLVVSSGPPLLTVPEVYGMTGRAAEDYLVGLGWRVTGIDGSSAGTVIGTDPEAGQQRVKGSPIRIITRSN